MKFLMTLLLSGIMHVNAVYIINKPDSDYVEYGKQFPSVGRFSYDDILDYASGVLIETGYPELDGRIVLTVAHNFDDVKSQTVSFTTDFGSSRGKFFLHEGYKSISVKDENTGKTKEGTINDIAFFLLDQKIVGNPLALINLESVLSPNECKTITIAGYGATAHLMNTFDIVNSSKIKRACQVLLLSEDLMNKNSGAEYFSEDDQNSALEAKSFETPYANDSICNGFFGPGDSGGGSFLNRHLIGLTAGLLDHTNPKLLKNKTVYIKDYYESIKHLFKSNDDTSDIVIAEATDLAKYFQPEYKLITENNIDINNFVYYGNLVRISHYKNWIQNMLLKFSQDLS